MHKSTFPQLLNVKKMGNMFLLVFIFVVVVVVIITLQLQCNYVFHLVLVDFLCTFDN